MAVHRLGAVHKLVGAVRTVEEAGHIAAEHTEAEHTQLVVAGHMPECSTVAADQQPSLEVQSIVEPQPEKNDHQQRSRLE